MIIVKYNKKLPEELQTIKPSKQSSFRQQMKLKKQLSQRTLKKHSLQTLAYIKYKHDQLTMIVDSIDEVTQMFLDMKILINDQSLLINNIVDNCEQAKEYTSDAVELIQSSKPLHKHYRIVCLLFLIIIIII